MMMLVRRIAAVAISAATMTLLAGGLPLAAQEPGTAQAESKTKSKTAKRSYDPSRRVPNLFGQLGLSDDQKESIYKIQGKHMPKIDALEKQLEELRAAMLKECESVLTGPQKQMLTERVPARPSGGPSGPAAAPPSRKTDVVPRAGLAGRACPAPHRLLHTSSRSAKTTAGRRRTSERGGRRRRPSAAHVRHHGATGGSTRSESCIVRNSPLNSCSICADSPGRIPWRSRSMRRSSRMAISASISGERRLDRPVSCPDRGRHGEGDRLRARMEHLHDDV